MGFEFAGFFAIADQTVLQSALERWRWMRGRTISAPFKGIGVSFDRQLILDEDDPVVEDFDAFEADIVAWSRKFSQVTFVYLEAECFGGPCDYAGFVVRNGTIIVRHSWPETVAQSKENLLHLLSYLHVYQIDFEPLSRGYFDDPARERLLSLLSTIEHALSRNLAALRVLAFGSMAREWQDGWSDIDLIVVVTDASCFGSVFRSLQEAKPILYHTPFESASEPVGSHVLGIVFEDEHPFHCVDLNFLTVDDDTPANLERFGLTRQLFSRSGDLSPRAREAGIDIVAVETNTDSEIGAALHFAKKATKQFLRGQGMRQDAIGRVKALRSVVEAYPPDVEVPNGQIGALAQRYLQVCSALLGI